jgi:hypothetical protein
MDIKPRIWKTPIPCVGYMELSDKSIRQERLVHGATYIDIQRNCSEILE